MVHDIERLVERLNIAVRHRLEDVGCYVRVGALSHEWAARINATGGLANPQFRARNIDGRDTRCAMIFECPSDPTRADQFIGAICWRFHIVDDYIAEFETGRLYHDDPTAVGWPTLITGIRDRLAFLRGLCCTRGAIRSFRETTPDRPGWRMIWWLSLFPMIECLERRVNYQVGIPWKHIGDRDAPRKWYGYQHQMLTRPLTLPFKNLDGSLVAPDASSLYFSWSSYAEIVEILRRRLVRLETARDHQLRDIAVADDVLHQPQEAPARESRIAVAEPALN